VIVIAGDTQGTGLVASIAEALTNEDLIERDILDLPGPDVVLEREHLVLTPDWEHAAVILGTPTTRYDHEDRLHLVTLGQLLDQRVRSLPFPSRRTRVDSRSMARGGSIWVEAIARPEDAVVVRELIEAEMLRLGEERVEAAELESAIRRAIRAREVESQSRHDRVLGLARVLTAGGEASAVEAYADLFDAVDPDQIRATAARYLNPLSATSITFSPER
jgi:predicted Zn-dependent peptidase